MTTVTIEQQNIIDADGNVVVIAKPGSGKTFVLSEKIKKILPLLNEYEGVIAISFTNKASEELKNRSLKNGLDRKESFFGTIHKFYISEIILSFGKQVFGLSQKPVDILDISSPELSNEEKNYLELLEKDFDYNNPVHINDLKNYFINGQIYLNLVEKFAIYIYNNSLSCQKYLKARYKYIIIDEFQDCGEEQFYIFMKMEELGLIAIAVGDLEQSIYEFTGKSSKFLSQLIKNKKFKTFALTKNHRCHPSIINYSLSLMSSNTELLSTEDIRVFHMLIDGEEKNISHFIDNMINPIMQEFDVSSLSQIGILTKVHRTASIIDQHLTTPHQIIEQSLLSQDSNPISQLYDDILKFVYTNNYTITEILEKFVILDSLKKKDIKLVKQCFQNIKTIVLSTNIDFQKILTFFQQISNIIIPNQEQKLSLSILKKVLEEQLDMYSSKMENKVQIMTLHKSKGLEFDIVFHLDLYEWILPSKWDNSYSNWSQDLNLHYVGITRAKKVCFLCTGTKRTNANNKLLDAKYSEFFDIKNLNQLRKSYTYKIP